MPSSSCPAAPAALTQHQITSGTPKHTGQSEGPPALRAEEERQAGATRQTLDPTSRVTWLGSAKKTISHPSPHGQVMWRSELRDKQEGPVSLRTGFRTKAVTEPEVSRPRGWHPRVWPPPRQWQRLKPVWSKAFLWQQAPYSSKALTRMHTWTSVCPGRGQGQCSSSLCHQTPLAFLQRAQILGALLSSGLRSISWPFSFTFQCVQATGGTAPTRQPGKVGSDPHTRQGEVGKGLESWNSHPGQGSSPECLPH